MKREKEGRSGERRTGDLGGFIFFFLGFLSVTIIIIILFIIFIIIIIMIINEYPAKIK